MAVTCIIYVFTEAMTELPTVGGTYWDELPSWL